MIKKIITITIFLLLISCAKSRTDFTNYDEQTSMIFGRIKIYYIPVEDKNGVLREVSHLCGAYNNVAGAFNDRKKRSSFFQHGLFISAEDSFNISYISCRLDAKTIIIPNLDLHLSSISIEKINYIGDIKIYLSDVSDKVMTLTTTRCSGYGGCSKSEINKYYHYPQKITLANNMTQTYSDLALIVKLPEIKKEAVFNKIKLPNNNKLKFTDDVSHLPF